MTNLQTISNQRDTAWSAFLALAFFVAAMVTPDVALAGGGGGNPLGTVLCTLVTWIMGPTGRAVATLAIIIIGVGALMGKVSWGMAIIVAIGIAIVFGAPTILTLLGGGAADCGAGLL
jgi:type IV secretion system protein VirB2